MPPPQQHKAPAPPPPSGPRYIAVYDYTAADDDEISFQEGNLALSLILILSLSLSSPSHSLSLCLSLSLSLTLSLFLSEGEARIKRIERSKVLTFSFLHSNPPHLLFTIYNIVIMWCNIAPTSGDTIIDVTVIDEGWMEGRVERTGAYGMLPSNYVEKA